MKKHAYFIGSVFLLLSSMGMMSLMTDNDKNKTVKVITAYLGNSDYSNGTIAKRTFDSLLKQGITARDSAGNSYKVTDFTFSYGERNLYEDSTGKLMVLTDYLSEFCTGDTLTTAFKHFVYVDKRTKPGDTAYLDKIRVHVPNGGNLGAKGMRFILTK